VDDLAFDGIVTEEKLLVTLGDETVDVEVGDAAEGTVVSISKDNAITLAQAILRRYRGTE
jgi:hypothetical protein